jgi:hypothetical protein
MDLSVFRVPRENADCWAFPEKMVGLVAVENRGCPVCRENGEYRDFLD